MDNGEDDDGDGLIDEDTFAIMVTSGTPWHTDHFDTTEPSTIHVSTTSYITDATHFKSEIRSDISSSYSFETTLQTTDFTTDNLDGGGNGHGANDHVGSSTDSHYTNDGKAKTTSIASDNDISTSTTFPQTSTMAYETWWELFGKFQTSTSVNSENNLSSDQSEMTTSSWEMWQKLFGSTNNSLSWEMWQKLFGTPDETTLTLEMLQDLFGTTNATLSWEMWQKLFGSTDKSLSWEMWQKLFGTTNTGFDQRMSTHQYEQYTTLESHEDTSKSKRISDQSLLHVLTTSDPYWWMKLSTNLYMEQTSSKGGKLEMGSTINDWDKMSTTNGNSGLKMLTTADLFEGQDKNIDATTNFNQNKDQSFTSVVPDGGLDRIKHTTLDPLFRTSGRTSSSDHNGWRREPSTVSDGDGQHETQQNNEDGLNDSEHSSSSSKEFDHSTADKYAKSLNPSTVSPVDPFKENATWWMHNVNSSHNYDTYFNGSNSSQFGNDSSGWFGTLFQGSVTTIQPSEEDGITFETLLMIIIPVGILLGIPVLWCCSLVCCSCCGKKGKVEVEMKSVRKEVKKPKPRNNPGTFSTVEYQDATVYSQTKESKTSWFPGKMVEPSLQTNKGSPNAKPSNSTKVDASLREDEYIIYDSRSSNSYFYDHESVSESKGKTKVKSHEKWAYLPRDVESSAGEDGCHDNASNVYEKQYDKQDKHENIELQPRKSKHVEEIIDNVVSGTLAQMKQDNSSEVKSYLPHLKANYKNFLSSSFQVEMESARHDIDQCNGSTSTEQRHMNSNKAISKESPIDVYISVPMSDQLTEPSQTNTMISLPFDNTRKLDIE